MVSDSPRPAEPDKHQHAGGWSAPSSARSRVTIAASTRKCNRASHSHGGRLVRSLVMSSWGPLVERRAAPKAAGLPDVAQDRRRPLAEQRGQIFGGDRRVQPSAARRRPLSPRAPRRPPAQREDGVGHRGLGGDGGRRRPYQRPNRVDDALRRRRRRPTEEGVAGGHPRRRSSARRPPPPPRPWRPFVRDMGDRGGGRQSRACAVRRAHAGRSDAARGGCCALIVGGHLPWAATYAPRRDTSARSASMSSAGNA